ncbi:MAG: hypothetical protein ACUZ8N_00560 [Candidatus Scalindua sp.]
MGSFKIRPWRENDPLGSSQIRLGRDVKEKGLPAGRQGVIHFYVSLYVLFCEACPASRSDGQKQEVSDLPDYVVRAG